MMIKVVVGAVCLAFASSQLIAPDSRWPLDASIFASEDPFVAAFGNDPTVCRNITGSVVTCTQINVIHPMFLNSGPPHIAWALHSGFKLAAKMLNDEQAMLPGYELVVHTLDTDWTALQKDKLVSDNLLNASTSPFVFVAGAWNLDGGFMYLLNRLRMPYVAANLHSAMLDATMAPAGHTLVNNAAQAYPVAKYVFEKCAWRRYGLVYDPVQFDYDATVWRQRLSADGYTATFVEQLTSPLSMDTIVRNFKNHRTRAAVVFLEGPHMVWFVCGLMLANIGRIQIIHWISVPWFLQAETAQDVRCRNPALLVRQYIGHYIGFYPSTYDATPGGPPLTCHPSVPKGDAQGAFFGYSGAALAAANAPFATVAHFGGFDIACHMALWLKHIILEQNRTVEELASRPADIYEEYLRWAWPSFQGTMGKISMQRFTAATGDFAGARNPKIEIIQITGDDFTKSPYFNVPPPWDVGMIWPDYEVTEDGTEISRFLDALRFENGSTTCPLEVFPDCGPGEELYFGVCTSCDKGRYLTADGECADCMPGTFQDQRGQDFCAECRAGKFNTQPGLVTCEFCGAGYYRPAGFRATECLPCEAGYFSTDAQSTSDIGMSKCQMCAFAEFQTEIGKANCTACPVGYTTKEQGSATSELCKCGEGFVEQDSSCNPCPLGMECPFGSTTEFGTAGAVAPALIPGYWSSAGEPLSVFACETNQHCVGGPPGYVCGPHLYDMSCVRCDTGFIMVGGKCVECTPVERSYMIFPVLPFLLSFTVVVFLYMISRGDTKNWKHWRTGFASVAFILINHYQLVNLLGTVDVQKPRQVTDTHGAFEALSDVLSVFRPPCIGFNNILQSMVTTFVTPIVGIGIFVGTWGASQLAAHIFPEKNLAMKVCITWGCYFGLIFSFFTGISQAAFVVLNCVPNPNGKHTLQADRSVLCYEGDWNALVVLGVLSIILWCVGYGVIFLRALYLAPKFFIDYEFRMRWKFLFIKFRTQAAWFSIFIMLKGVIINACFSFLQDPLHQIYLSLTVFAIYSVTVGLVHPWRIWIINAIDLVSHASLNFFGLFLTWFVVPDIDKNKAVEGLSITVAFNALIVGVLGSATMIYQQVAHHRQKHMEALIANVRPAFGRVAGVDGATFKNFMGELLDDEIFAFTTATTMASKLPEVRATPSYDVGAAAEDVMKPFDLVNVMEPEIASECQLSPPRRANSTGVASTRT